MSIRTHRIAKNKRVNNAGTLRQTDTVGSNCKLFFPCDEGAGTTLTDESATGIGLDNADAQEAVSYAVANRMSAAINNSGASVAPSTGDVSSCSPGANSFVVCLSGVMNLVAASVAAQVGADAGPYIKVGHDEVAIHDGTNSVSVDTSSLGASGTDAVNVFLVVDREKGTGKAYASLNTNALTTFEVDIDDIGSITLVNEMVLGANLGFPPSLYAWSMHVFEDGVPETILADIDTWLTNMKGSNKTLPANWIAAQ